MLNRTHSRIANIESRYPGPGLFLSLLLLLPMLGWPARVAASSSPRSSSLVAAPIPTDGARLESGNTLELVGWIGGSHGSAVAVAGDYAYVVVGPRLLVLDVTHPDRPRLVGQTTLPPIFFTSIALHRGYAYLSNGSDRTLMVDITNPKEPTLVDAALAVNAQHIVFQGEYGYVADSDGLKIFQVADPTHWTLMSSTRTDGGYFRLGIAGDVVYAAGDGLHIIDVTDPRRPAEIGAYTETRNIADFVITGNTAWVGTADLARGSPPKGTLHIVDVTNSAKPAKVSVLAMEGPVDAVSIAGGFVYVAAVVRVRIFNAADPKNPREVGAFRTTAPMTDLALAGQRMYLASSTGDSLRVVDVAHPEQPAELGSFIMPKSAYEVAVAGPYAYIADSQYGLLVMDVSDPRAPVPVGSSARFSAWGVVLAGDYAYVAGSGSLRILSLADPIHPVEVGAATLPDTGERLAVVGNRAYVAAGKAFVVVDISHPAAPTLLGAASRAESFALDVAIRDRYAFVAAGPGLRVVDISDSAHPTDVAFLPMSGWASGVRISGNYAYVAATSAGLHVVNIANPTQPVEVGSYPTSNALAVTLADTWVYVADGYGGLRVVDVADPTRPVEVASYKDRGSTWKATVTGDYIYAAGLDYGIVVLRVDR